MKDYRPEDIVKSCRRLESGLRFGPDAIHACCLGPVISPPYWSAAEAREQTITKEMVIEKRKALFEMLNDDCSDISCKRCMSVEEKPFKEVRFDQLGHLNLAHFSMCNLRCSYCGYTLLDHFVRPQYDALKILEQFSPEDSQWDAYVDLNGGEPTLLKDLDQYIDFFHRNKIRVLFYTNAIRYSQEIYDGVKSGSIPWVIISLDAGIPSTFQALKKSTKYQVVLDNITRYSHAGGFGRGSVAVKYVFCAGNTGMDDVTGFVYTMLAIRPQKIWLTIDFTPLCQTYEGQEAIGVYDFSPHIEAYAQTYVLLKRHGLDPVHFVYRHLSGVMEAGQDMFEKIEKRIAELMPDGSADPHLLLEDFRAPPAAIESPQSIFDFAPLRQIDGGHSMPWSLQGKRVMIAPMWRNAAALVADPDILQSDFIGFLDRSPTLQGRKVYGWPVFNYDQLASLAPDVILVDAPEQHRNDIIAAISRVLGERVTIAVLGRKTDETVR